MPSPVNAVTRDENESAVAVIQRLRLPPLRSLLDTAVIRGAINSGKETATSVQHEAKGSFSPQIHH